MDEKERASTNKCTETFIFKLKVSIFTSIFMLLFCNFGKYCRHKIDTHFQQFFGVENVVEIDSTYRSEFLQRIKSERLDYLATAADSISKWQPHESNEFPA